MSALLNLKQIILKKANNENLSFDELNFFIKETCLKQTKNDSLIAAWICAVYINHLSIDEAVDLTKIIINSSQIVDLSNIKSTIVDKHSTGGVGDKVTLILTPILVAAGLKVAKISGRGLGHTGGTIDKLESIGVKTNIDNNKMIKMLGKENMFVAAQTEKLAPADKALYSMRDATGLVKEYGLIAASILGKKFSISNTHVFLDLKVGSGSLCKNNAEAKELTKYLLAIAKKLNRKLSIMITEMDQPLGRAIGNAIEIKETIDFLFNYKNASNDLKELLSEMTIDIFLETKISKTRQQGLETYQNLLENNAALNCFYSWINAQGANIVSLANDAYFKPKYNLDIISSQDGYMKFKSTEEVGLIACELGAGRKNKTDKIDFQAGIYLHKKEDEMITKGCVFATLYSSNPINENLKNRYLDNVVFNKNAPKNRKMIKEIIK